MEYSKRGGARHFAKPHVDSGILFTILSAQMDIVADLGAYEVISRTNAPDFLASFTPYHCGRHGWMLNHQQKSMPHRSGML